MNQEFNINQLDFISLKEQSGDVILSCNGVKGIKAVTGPAYSLAHLTLKRKDEILELDCVRLPKEFIK